MSAAPGDIDAIERRPRRWALFRPVLRAGPVRKWLLRALASIVAVAVLYLAAVNVMLRTRILRNLVNVNPMTVLVEYDEAHSFWPGTASVKNLHLRGRDGAVEWLLTVDDAKFHVSLLDLAHHTFHVTWVEGHGVAFHLRTRQPRDVLTPGRLAAIPRIPGFAEAPLADTVKPPPPTDAEYHLWKIELDDVVADPVRDVWIDVVRQDGDSRVTGRFLLQPLRWLEVGPAAIVTRQTDLWTGSAAIARDVAGEIHVTIHGFDLRDPEVLPHVSADAKVDGRIPDLTFVDAAQTKVDVQGGGGRAHFDAAIDEGKLVRAASWLESRDANVTVAEHAITAASGRASLRTIGDDVVCEVAITGASARRLGSTGPLVEATSLKGVLRSHERSLQHLFAHPVMSLDVPDAKLPDMHLFDAYLPKDGAFHVEGGRGALRARFDADGRTAKGVADLTLTDTTVKVAEALLRGDLRAETKIDRATESTGDIDLSGSHAEFANVRVATGKTVAPPWSGRVDLGAARLELLPKPLMTASIAASCRDARPLATLLAANSALPMWAADLVALEGVTGSMQLRAAKDRLELRGIRAKVEHRFDVAGDYLKEGDRARSLALVTSGPFGVGIESNQGTTLHLFNARTWYVEAERAFP